MDRPIPTAAYLPKAVKLTVRPAPALEWGAAVCCTSDKLRVSKFESLLHTGMSAGLSAPPAGQAAHSDFDH